MRSGGGRILVWCLAASFFVAGCSSVEPTVMPAATATLSVEEKQAAADREVAALRAEVRRLDGYVVTLSREREEMRRRQEALETKMNSLSERPAPVPTEPLRIATPTPTPPPPPPTATPTPEPTSMVVPARDLYQMGIDSFQKGNYPKAVLLFQEYLVNYRSTDLADNAQYWIGESLYAQGEHNRALASFESVVANYPRGNKVPAAMLKIALTYQRLGQNEKAAKGFRELMDRHPKSPEARIARDTLGKAQ